MMRRWHLKKASSSDCGNFVSNPIFSKRGALMRWFSPRLLGFLLVVQLLSGCAVLRQFSPSVEVSTLTPREYVALKRGDYLTMGKRSSATDETVSVASATDVCLDYVSNECVDRISSSAALSDERRHSALAELWLEKATIFAKKHGRRVAVEPELRERIDLWMNVARHSYAYLFLMKRPPHQRAFEDRQTQVRDYYNLAVQEVTSALFLSMSASERNAQTDVVQSGNWRFSVELVGQTKDDTEQEISELLPAASLWFSGLRSVYRRDGFGAEFVAVLNDPVDRRDKQLPLAETREPRWTHMNTPALTVLLDISGGTLQAVIESRDVKLRVYDPYQLDHADVRGVEIPLAANFTAGYGLWLARSGFSRQSLDSLFGGANAVDEPRLFMMQPYDPNRGVILMIHGLASSPEAWVNVANEIAGDADIRSRYQIWQIYYPTNVPIAYNHFQIRQVVTATLRSFDPDGSAAASKNMVVIGHSMGGIMSRLLVSSSGDSLWDTFIASRNMAPGQLDRVRERAREVLRFEPVPAIDTAILVATPHRGTDAAGARIAQWIGELVVLPINVLKGMGDVLQTMAGDSAGRKKGSEMKLRNGIQNLEKKDPFIVAASDLTIARQVSYHSIIAKQGQGPLESSSDGVVPYWSSHLPGARSELVLPGGHSIQETPEAVAEIRRILRQRLQSLLRPDGGGKHIVDPAPSRPVAPERCWEVYESQSRCN